MAHGADSRGFTLIELMVAMVISAIATAGIYEVYMSQHKAYVIQERVADMQQNLRAGLDIMVREIRAAGYDPRETGFSPISSADSNKFAFLADLNGDGDTTDTGEQFSYELFDAGGDGINDLRRTPGGEAVAYNIDALGFAYSYDDDGDGEADLSANGNIIWAVGGSGGNWYNLDTDDDGDIDINDTAGGVNTGTVKDLGAIRGVMVWMVVRADGSDTGFTNTNTYVAGAARLTPNDNVRRRALVAKINCRNLGL